MPKIPDTSDTRGKGADKPSPITGYTLSREERAKGGRVSAERRREAREMARLSAEEIIRRRVNERLDRLVVALLDKTEESGNIAVFNGLWDRGYGPPTQRQEIEDVTEREELDDTARERHARIRDELKRRNAA